MKPKILKLLTNYLLLLPLCVALLGAGCNKNEDSQSVLDGKWILLGFGNDSTGEFISEPEAEPKSSFVIFSSGELVAYSVTNTTYDVSYIIKGEIIIVTNKGGRTKVGGDTEWGLKFLKGINDINKYSIINGELILYYEDHKFMEFKKETI